MPSRHGQLSLAAILSAQSPTIDLHLPAYEASTRNFSQAIADFNTRAIAEINQRWEAHGMETKRPAERAQNMEKETNQCKMKEIELIGGSCRATRVRCVPISLFFRVRCFFFAEMMFCLLLLQCSNVSARTRRRQNPLSPLSDVRSRSNKRQSRLSTRRLSSTAHAWRTSVKVRFITPTPMRSAHTDL